MKARVLIITGDGLNCEAETARAFEIAGAQACRVHITALLSGKDRLEDYQGLAFIGGFSNGDHLGAGTVQSCRFKHRLKEDLDRFIQRRRPIIGICNGFQTLVKMGILPGAVQKEAHRTDWVQTATIMPNDSGKFEDRWVHLLIDTQSPCIWTRGVEQLFLPVRHGEGKFFTTDTRLISQLGAQNRVVARYTDPDYSGPVMDYPFNPNGSLEAVAAVCDPSGIIFGLMPHPEAFLSPYNHPSWTRTAALGRPLPEHGEGAVLFRNAVSYMEEA
jgi:phosphoribosylformylglycinamidine synthase